MDNMIVLSVLMRASEQAGDGSSGKGCNSDSV